MAFDKNNRTGSKNQFVASIVSVKSGHHIAFVNPTDTFARQVLGGDIPNVTAAMVMEKLAPLIDNEFVELRVTDTTVPVEMVAAIDY